MIDEQGNIKYDGFRKANIISELKARIVLKAREKMYNAFLDSVHPSKEDKILDSGVSPAKGIPNQKILTNNYFERRYPWKNKITATSIEDASFLEQEYPGLKFVQCEPYKTNFVDREFDAVFCNAVVEHAGTREQQKMFVHEYCRVGKKVFFTTPNRWFPFEPHSALPFIHWLPPKIFRAVLRVLGKGALADESILNLLDAKDFKNLFPSSMNIKVINIKTLGLSSNICVYGEWITNG